MFKIFRSKKGFSLVELIVVIAILGVISAIAIPAVLNTLSDSKVKADIATAQSISKAVNVAIVSANSDSDKNNDIEDGDKNTDDGGLKSELAKTFPTWPTPQTGGTFSVEVTTVANGGTWEVNFSKGKVDQTGTFTETK